MRQDIIHLAKIPGSKRSFHFGKYGTMSPGNRTKSYDVEWDKNTELDFSDQVGRGHYTGYNAAKDAFEYARGVFISEAR